MRKEYLKIDRIEGQVIMLKGDLQAGYGHVITLKVEPDEIRYGQIIRIDEQGIWAQIFQGTQGLSAHNTSVTFEGKSFDLALSKEMLGRQFNGMGEPLDDKGPFYASLSQSISRIPDNPLSRNMPNDFFDTGLSIIDVMMPIALGQKIGLFSGNGLPHKKMICEIIKSFLLDYTRTRKRKVILATMGIKNDDLLLYKHFFKQAGLIDQMVMFVNVASDPIIERVNTPHLAMTSGRYFAFEENEDVLVVLDDIAHYCDALKEISAAREEVPSRKGYPGYLYSQLSKIYEGAGSYKEKEGSLTLIPVLTMPGDDISHPIPDLTGYITEGQWVLDRGMFQQGVYPPISLFSSLSRKGEKRFKSSTYESLIEQVFLAYQNVAEVRALAQIMGASDLTKKDQSILKFGDKFEKEFMHQGEDRNFNIEESLKRAEALIEYLPETFKSKIKGNKIDE
jgi:V/A-type H+-transporting ATPase subunit B